LHFRVKEVHQEDPNEEGVDLLGKRQGGDLTGSLETSVKTPFQGVRGKRGGVNIPVDRSALPMRLHSSRSFPKSAPSTNNLAAVLDYRLPNRPR